MTTSTRPQTDKASASAAYDEPVILDTAPTFRRQTGRSKSPVRLAIEELPLDKWMVLATVHDDDTELSNALSNIRNMARSVTLNTGHKYSVRTTTERQVAVGRTA